MKSKELLRLALVLGLSCNSLGLSTMAVEDKSLHSEITVPTTASTYTEETFFNVARWALKDVLERMDVYEQGGEFTFSYKFNLLKGWNKQELNEKTVRDVLTCVLKAGLDSLQDGYDIVLPSLLNSVYMHDDGQKIIDQWKKDGIYNSKIEKIVEPYVKKFVEKFQKQLENQELLKNKN